MKYCSECGSPVTQELLAGDSLPRFICVQCKTVHYRNPKILVACISHFGERILLCRRAHDPGRGRWMIPTGFMEIGETIEETAVRETAEETGLNLDPEDLELYGVLSLPDINEVYVTLRVQLARTPTLVAGPESLEVAMMGKNDIALQDWAFAGVFIKDQAALLFSEVESGTFGIHKMRMGRNIAGGYDSRTYALSA